MRRKSLWIFGIIAPVFFVLSVFLLALLNPRYSHIYHTISELGEIGAVTAQPASIMFVVTGGMLMVFGYDLQETLHRQDKRVWCGILVILYGFFDFVGSGIFPVDAGGASTTLVATVHVYTTLIGELAVLGIPIWFLKDTEGGFGWDELRKFSRVCILHESSFSSVSRL